ncbi:MAG: hypothetical protein RL330_430 [Actinomycetota bacterium]
MPTDTTSVRHGDTGHRYGPTEWALTATIALTWGASFLFIAVAIDHVATQVVPLGRLAFGALALALIPAARGRIGREDLGRFIVLGVVSMTIPFHLYPLAEHTVSSSVTGMINGSIPVTTVVVTAVLARSLPSRQRVVAVLIGFTGIAFISFSSIGGEDNAASVHGVALLILATCCYAATAGLSRELQVKYGTLRTMMWAEIIALVASLPFGLPALARSSFSWEALGALFMLGTFGTGFAYLVYGTLIVRAGTVRGMIGVFFTPVVATLLGVLVRDERISMIAVAGMFVVILGAWLTSKPDMRSVAAGKKLPARAA